ncbi:MAG: hypothetical protein NVS3B2_05410 [Ramlibacter sp.]
MQLQVNGKAAQVDADPAMPLLWVLRDVLELTGTKYGCGIGACGACTVRVEGQPVRFCARGVALHESFGTIVAQVAEVSLEGGVPRVHRVTCAVDCGIVINPDIVAQQLEGSVVFALSAALYGRVDLRGGVVQQTNFPGSPLVTAARAPTVETWLVPNDWSRKGWASLALRRWRRRWRIRSSR